jgi:hypothetical protein
MTTPFTELTAAVARRAHQPIPLAWVALEPALAMPNLGAIGPVIRDRTNVTRSDELIRALVRLAPRDSVAATVLLNAVASYLENMPGCLTTTEHRYDLLGDLAVVLLEPFDLDLSGLARRLARRAHSRARERQRTEARRQQHLVHLADRDLPPDPSTVEDLAVDRAQIAELRRAVDQAIARGELTSDTWQVYTDARLRRRLGLATVAHDRSVSYRATKKVTQILAHAG